MLLKLTSKGMNVHEFLDPVKIFFLEFLPTYCGGLAKCQRYSIKTILKIYQRRLDLGSQYPSKSRQRSLWMPLTRRPRGPKRQIVILRES